MGDMAVDAAVGEQAHQVQGAAPLLTVVHGLQIGWIFKKGTVLHRLGDAGQVLEHHPACADVGVAHLTVAHLPLGQTHIQTGGGELAARAGGKEPVQIRRTGIGNGVALLLCRQAKSVHDNQGSRRFTHNKPRF